MKIVKTLLSFMVMFATLITFTANSDAATTKTMNAKVANSVYVRSQPSVNGKKVGTLWKGDTVIVYSKSKTGWAKIKFNKKTAYVYASYLTFAKKAGKSTTQKQTTSSKSTSKKTVATKKTTTTSKSTSTSKKTTYRPVTTNTYYYVENGKNGKMYSTNKRNSTGWTYWYKKTGTDKVQTILVRESAQGLDYKFTKTGTVRQIVYPFTKGQVFKAGTKNSKIVYILNKMTVKAGTYNTVVGVKAADGSITYYAPNAGAIKTIKNNKTIFELTKVTTK
ncbi:SH3 domain-containing protein [Rummeliibacillus pycnus]|uniref:SH3 domain-containing protein n=1 Tax=Rummeliibacillus pycnus TaxID=101070 RepID=UPI001476414F|nr:SH3 domain-containing protein [Rummeliibacillus pycnus]